MSTTVKNSQITGIDLGTTNSVITILDDVGKAKVIPNLEGEFITPSVVFVSDDGSEILVGRAAMNMMMLKPENVFVEFKRDVGKGNVYKRFGNLDITPEWCQTQVLTYLRRSTNQFTGDDLAASKVVVGVPANVGEKERQCVKQSVEQSGAELLQFIHEPTAACLAFGVNEKQGERLVVIIDWGGGTLDVTVVQYSGGQATVLATDGEKQLGGKDIDQLLINLVLERFQREHGLDISPQSHPADYYMIREEVIRQKHMLASRREVRLAARVDGKQVAVNLTRDEFNALINPLVERVLDTTLRALQGAKVELADVKHVLLVGGSSRVVSLQERIRQQFGPDSILGGQVSPDFAIAEGAVIHAVKVVSSMGSSVVNHAHKAIPLPAIKHQDVTAHSLGVTVQDPVSLARFCSVILERNSPIPSQSCKTYGSIDDAQTQFQILVVQGEEGQAVDDCLVVGERVLDLPARSRLDPSLDATMSYDASGMVHVFVHDRVSGKSEDITVDFYSKQPVGK